MAFAVRPCLGRDCLRERRSSGRLVVSADELQECHSEERRAWESSWITTPGSAGLVMTTGEFIGRCAKRAGRPSRSTGSRP
jgi:hypothetical protein